MKNKKMLFGDVITNVIVLILCLISVFVMSKIKSKDEYVNVYVGDNLYGTYSLLENVTFSPNQNKNVITIKDGKAFVSESDCPDGLCKSMPPISKDTVSSVVCLPNKVAIVKTKTLLEGGVDALAG